MLKIRGPALDQYGAALHLIHDASRKAAHQARADLFTGKLTQSDFADRRRRQRDALEHRLNSIEAYWSAAR
jgi:hypothetical protein